MKNTELNIDTLHYDDLANLHHPSIFDRNEGYDMLIIRLPIMEKMHEFEMVSFGFVITDEKGYIFDKTTQLLQILPDRFKSIFETIDEKVDLLLNTFKLYQDEISKMEVKLYAQKIEKDFMSNWFRHKRDIVRIERVVSLAAGVLREFVEVYENHNDFPVNNYFDLLEHCERIHKSASLQLAKLDYIYSFYSTYTAEKMNRIIFVLTLISGIFLPLNLFVGFFGMNTSNLPFAGSENGTMRVLAIMMAVTLLSVFAVVLWKRWIEKTEE